jgi:hypothetical protein
MSSQRKKYVDHTVRCSACGDVLIEVFAPMITGEVVIGHRSVDLDLDVLTRPEPYKPARRRAREWKYTTHVHMADPFHGDSWVPSSVSSTCRCTYSRHFDVNELIARTGQSSTESPYRRDWRDG